MKICTLFLALSVPSACNFTRPAAHSQLPANSVTPSPRTSIQPVVARIHAIGASAEGNPNEINWVDLPSPLSNKLVSQLVSDTTKWQSGPNYFILPVYGEIEISGSRYSFAGDGLMQTTTEEWRFLESGVAKELHAVAREAALKHDVNVLISGLARLNSSLTP
jgi:hypothetical protein